MGNAEILNTPGYFYSLAYCVSNLVVFTNCKKRYSNFKSIIIYIAFFITLVSFMTITDGVKPIFFIPCILFTIGIIQLFIYKSCKLSMTQAAYYSARTFILGEFMASFAWQITYFALIKKFVELNFRTCIFFIIIIYAILFLIFYLIEKYYFDSKTIKIYPKELVTVVLISLSVFIISNLNYFYYNTSISDYITSDYFTIRTLVDLSGLVLLYAYHIQKKELNSKNEVFLMQNILNIQYLNYRMMQESMDIVNEKYHDLKHQIFLLKKEAVSEESLSYLSKLEADIKLYEINLKTGHRILDTVLTGKSLQCKNKNISLTCVVDGCSLNFMDDMDICALFGNLLDNSIEAVEKIENLEERIIHLTLAVKKNFLRIGLTNQCIDSRNFKNEIPKTTKKNKNLHGFGLRSIENTVNKYGGVLAMENKNNTFSIRILIPLEG